MNTFLRKAFGDRSFEGAGKENKHIARMDNGTVRNLRYNEVNVIGSPAANAIRHTMKYTVPSVLGGPFLCKSSVRPYFPYLMSEYDAIAWRKAEVNLPSTLNDYAKNKGGVHIGSLSASNPNGNTWGPVHPRIGFVYQTDSTKAAAVAAQRGIDIVTKPHQLPHVYKPYGYNGYRTVYEQSAVDCSDNFGVWERDPYCVQSLPGYPGYSDMSDDEKQRLEEEQCPINCRTASSFVQKMPPADVKSVAWQMITPRQSSSCEAFGSPNPNWSRGKNAEDGQYAWNYWRQYECCKPGPGILLNP